MVLLIFLSLYLDKTWNLIKMRLDKTNTAGFLFYYVILFYNIFALKT